MNAVVGMILLCGLATAQTPTLSATITHTQTVVKTETETESIAAVSVTPHVVVPVSETDVEELYTSNDTCKGQLALGTDSMQWDVGVEVATGLPAVEICVTVVGVIPSERVMQFTSEGSVATMCLVHSGSWTSSSSTNCTSDFIATTTGVCAYSTAVSLVTDVTVTYTPSAVTATTAFSCNEDSDSSDVWLIIMAAGVLLILLVVCIVGAVMYSKNAERETFTSIQFTEAVDLLTAKEMLTESPPEQEP